VRLFRDVTLLDWIGVAAITSVLAAMTWTLAHVHYANRPLPRWFDRHVFPRLRPLYDYLDPPPVFRDRRQTPPTLD
jgi:hypothetical protein